MTAIDPNKVHFTGENSFLRLRTEADGPETTVCAHWRTLISPAGPGTCLFLAPTRPATRSSSMPTTSGWRAGCRASWRRS